MSATPVTAQRRGGLYLTFVLADEQYGIEILKVNAILSMMPLTPLPQAPHYVKGVINLRGKIIPVIDTRLRFGMMEIEHTPETCIIVVDLKGTLMGMVVDTVKDVVNISDEQIEDPPRYGTSMDSEYILGLGKIDKEVKILLKIEAVLGELDTSGIAEIPL